MMESAEASIRPKPSRTALAFVVAADLAIGGAVGFAVYFAKREFGPPTPPRNVEASATLCVPDDCAELAAATTLTWQPPAAGSEVTTYVVRRDGEEIGRTAASERTFTDDDVVIDGRYGYDVTAIGLEGRGRPSPLVDVRVPIPPIEQAHFVGDYSVELVFKRIGLLSRFEGVQSPAVGDRTTQDWDLLSSCSPLAGACDVALFGYELARDGRDYEGELPSEAFCGSEHLTSKRTVMIRLTKARVIGRVLVVTAFAGSSVVDFRCGGNDVHAVAAISGSRV